MGNSSSHYRRKREERKRAERQKTLELWIATVCEQKEEWQSPPSPQHQQKRKQSLQKQGQKKAKHQHRNNPKACPRPISPLEDTLKLLSGQGIRVKLIVGGEFHPAESLAHRVVPRTATRARAQTVWWVDSPNPPATPSSTPAQGTRRKTCYMDQETAHQRIVSKAQPLREIDCYLRLSTENDFLFVVPEEPHRAKRPSKVLNAMTKGMATMAANLPLPSVGCNATNKQFIFCPIESAPRKRRGTGRDSHHFRGSASHHQLTTSELAAKDRKRGFTRCLSVGTRGLAIREEVNDSGRRTLLLWDAAALAAATATGGDHAGGRRSPLLWKGGRPSPPRALPPLRPNEGGGGGGGAGALRLAAPVPAAGAGEGAAAAAAAAHSELGRRLRIAAREAPRRRSRCDAGPALDYDLFGEEGL